MRAAIDSVPAASARWRALDEFQGVVVDRGTENKRNKRAPRWSPRQRTPPRSRTQARRASCSGTIRAVFPADSTAWPPARLPALTPVNPLLRSPVYASLSPTGGPAAFCRPGRMRVHAGTPITTLRRDIPSHPRGTRAGGDPLRRALAAQGARGWDRHAASTCAPLGRSAPRRWTSAPWGSPPATPRWPRGPRCRSRC